MTKTIHVRGLVWVLACAMLLTIYPSLLLAQDAAVETPPATPAAPMDLDFDTAEFEDFGEEDFVVEEQLDPKTDAAITAVKVVVGVLLLLGLIWIVTRIFRGRGSPPGAG